MANSKGQNLRSYKLAIFAFVTISIIIITVALSSSHLLAHQKKAESITASECQVLGVNHFVYIKDNRFYPRDTEAKLCDVITLVNHGKYRLIAFGQHSNHIEYNGYSEQPLKQDGSITIVLNQSGDYMYHDHLQDYVFGTFSVESDPASN